VTADERERSIEAILNSPWGIYAAEVCQLCGAIGTFSGWANAVGSHVRLCAGGEFVAPDHDHQYGRHAPERYRAILESQGWRFCDVCQARVPHRQAQAVNSYWLCAACARQAAAGTETVGQMLNTLGRRRYLERMTDEELSGWERSVSS
jgi:ribosomal protein L37AE/L43A